MSILPGCPRYWPKLITCKFTLVRCTQKQWTSQSVALREIPVQTMAAIIPARVTDNKTKLAKILPVRVEAGVPVSGKMDTGKVAPGVAVAVGVAEAVWVGVTVSGSSIVGEVAVEVGVGVEISISAAS